MERGKVNVAGWDAINVSILSMVPSNLSRKVVQLVYNWSIKGRKKQKKWYTILSAKL
jgi:hypothetical protein